MPAMMAKISPARPIKMTSREQQKADAEKGQNTQRRPMPTNSGDGHSDLKIQRRLAVDVHGRDFILLDLPDQQRAENVAERDDETGQRAQMAQHVPGARLAFGSRERRGGVDGGGWAGGGVGLVFGHRFPFVGFAAQYADFIPMRKRKFRRKFLCAFAPLR